MLDKKHLTSTAARVATLNQLIKTTLPNFIDPIPCRATLRTWMNKANVPRMKANPTARKGGGIVFYSVPHVERMFKSRLLPGRIVTMPEEA